MKVLVTGGAGFVGGHLIPRLIQSGYEVVCFVHSENRAEELQNKYDHVSCVVGDVTLPETVGKIPLDVDYAIHMAATGHVSATSQEAYDHFVSINEGGTKNLVEHFSKSDTLKKFVHFSSTAAMGPALSPVLNEDSAPNPKTPYQKSKFRSEQIIRDAYQTTGFPGVVIRPCMIYGAGGYGEFYKFCRLMRKGVFPKVGFGKNLTPLVYVDDVVSGAVLAMEKGLPGETYLITSKTSIPMDDMRDLIVKNIGCNPPYIPVPSFLALSGAFILEKLFDIVGKEPIVTYRNIKSTIVDRTFDISKAQAQLGYEPAVSFEDGIARTISWYKQQGKF